MRRKKINRKKLKNTKTVKNTPGKSKVNGPKPLSGEHLKKIFEDKDMQRLLGALAKSHIFDDFNIAEITNFQDVLVLSAEDYFKKSMAKFPKDIIPRLTELKQFKIVQTNIIAMCEDKSSKQMVQPHLGQKSAKVVDLINEEIKKLLFDPNQTLQTLRLTICNIKKDTNSLHDAFYSPNPVSSLREKV
eukprot:UN04139